MLSASTPSLRLGFSGSDFIFILTTGSAADAAAPVAISPSPRCHGAWEFGLLALAAAVPCGAINCRSPQGGDGSPGEGR